MPTTEAKDIRLRNRRDDLVRSVLAPLILGGPIEPVRPFGGLMALRLGSPTTSGESPTARPAPFEEEDPTRPSSRCAPHRAH